jgi:hypothetical protein
MFMKDRLHVQRVPLEDSLHHGLITYRPVGTTKASCNNEESRRHSDAYAQYGNHKEWMYRFEHGKPSAIRHRAQIELPYYLRAGCLRSSAH